MVKAGEKAAALGLLGLIWGATHLLTRGEFETKMLPPGMEPKGEGWEPMTAVTHTSLYGGLAGKPVARVVWKRHRPTLDPHDGSPSSLFLKSQNHKQK